MTVDADGNDVQSMYKIQVGDSANPFPADLTQFVESLVDLSAFAREKDLYRNVVKQKKQAETMSRTSILMK